MGCFCRQAVSAMQVDIPTAGIADGAQAADQDQILTAVGNWLGARGLPALPWQPDPAWLDIDLPHPAMPPAAFSVLSALVQGQLACAADLALDPTQPGQVAKLARIVTTLNRRLAGLEPVVGDGTAWEHLAALNDQVDLVTQVVDQGMFTESASGQPQQHFNQPLGPWRPLLAKIKALAPLMSILQTLDIDPLDGAAAANRIADQVRLLRAVSLPTLDQPSTVFQLIARYGAIARLQASLGADPRRVPFARVQRAVQARVDAARQLLPKRIQLVNGQLVGMPSVQPNPGQLLTPVTVKLAQSIPPTLLDRLRWQVPAFDQLDMLTTAVPVAKLVGLLRTLGMVPVRSAPCDRGCDAGAATAISPL